MNNEIGVSIPGKIVISGEYAVLDGALAILTTLNQKVNIKIQESDKNHNVYLTSALEGIFPFTIDDDANIIWLEADPGTYGLLLQHAFKILKPMIKEKLSIIVDSSEFFRTTKDGTAIKLGIGSSAAVSVGITQALFQYQEIVSSPGNLLTQANIIHQTLQGKQGSGIDVTCCFADQGVIECTKDSVKNQTWSILNWPYGLHLKVLTTGQGASTKRLVTNYKRASNLYPKEFKNSLDQFMGITQNLSHAWKSEDVDHIIGLLTAYDVQIKKLDKIGDIGIYTQVHTEVQNIASRYNVFYKPSGAGGGDIGLAFSSSLDELNDFSDEISTIAWNIGCLD
jgi:phosphomevalonate kinase